MQPKRWWAIVLVAVACAMAMAAQAVTKIDPRFDTAATYLEYLSQGDTEKAYALLAWPMSFEEFKQRIDASNEGLAKELKEQGIDLVSKTIARVAPMTFEDQYIIVTVQSEIVGKRGEEIVKDDVTYQMYFRFNKDGKIDLVHAIGEGWIC